jgi:hypothetical protein
MSPNLQVILQQAEQLTPEERLELIRQIAECNLNHMLSKMEA